jgi:hypothetical protein
MEPTLEDLKKQLAALQGEGRAADREEISRLKAEIVELKKPKEPEKKPEPKKPAARKGFLDWIFE